jgi:hypothetical protein
MMDKMPKLGGRSHGGGTGCAQARRRALRNPAKILLITEQRAETETCGSISEQKKPCSNRGGPDKDYFKFMSLRSFSYWLACCIAAAMAVGATEPEKAGTPDLTLPGTAISSVISVPEPSRALLLFAGIMAMAFTYRHAWLSWKRSAQS